VETARHLPLLMRDGRRILPLRRADLRHEVRQLDLRWFPGKNKGLDQRECTLIKEKTKIFLIYKEIQMGSGAKSYMRKFFLIYEEMHKYMTLHPNPLNFLIYEDNFILFFISAPQSKELTRGPT
jgi:hypothetical protein